MSDQHLISLQPGTVIGGKYEVVKCLGAGSMGMVYACRHRELQGQMVAAKVLFHEVAADKVAAARFKNEVLASYGVSHPNVVRAYDYITDGDLVAYTMEFVGGGDLADRMSRSQLMSIAEFVRLLSQMTAGVQAIHDAGIVHRDLKPENILLTNEGNVKIADFGIARNRNGPKLTEHGGVVGTIEYVAPEYMLRAQVDWRSDIYALGILAFEMLTGEPPFKGDSPYESISKRLQVDPDPPSKLRKDCPADIDAIILKALQRDPEVRYQSAMEIFTDLQRAAASAGIQAQSGSGLYMPTGTLQPGQRYVGPSLMDSSTSAAPTQPSHETQLLNSDGSLDASDPRGRADTQEWSASNAHSVDVSGPKSSSVTDSAGKVRQALDCDTEVLSASYVQYSLSGAEAEDSPRMARSQPPIRGPEGYHERSGFRDRHTRSHTSTEFPVDLLEASNRRLRVLDMLTLLIAVFLGVAFGLVFLKIFSPSFLEKLNLFGGQL
jgi:serine/threonine protein kinase